MNQNQMITKSTVFHERRFFKADELNFELGFAIYDGVSFSQPEMGYGRIKTY